MERKFYRKVLKNGLTVVFESRPGTKVVSVALAVRSGGMHEQISEKGLSHLIEHMLYKGTPTRNSREIAEEIEKRGGDLNGFTDESLTAYWCKIPSKHLKTALEVLADMVKNPLFDKNELDKERQVILEEIKMRRDDPRVYVLDAVHKVLYKEPFGFPLIGSEKTLGAFTRKEILKRFEDFYQPNNFVVCVVGDASFEDVLSFAKDNFSEGKGKTVQIKIKKQNVSKVEERKGIDQANLVFAHHVPTSEKGGSYAAFLLNVLLAGGMSSRLFHEIREKRNLAYAIKGAVDISRNFAYSLIYAGTKKESVSQIRELILEEYKKVSKDLSEKELSQVKEQVIGNHQISVEDSQNQMVNLLMHEINGDAKELYEFEKKIRAVSLKDVQNLAAQVKKGNYSFFALVPE